MKVSIEFTKMDKELFHLQQKYTEVPEDLAKIKLPERLGSTVVGNTLSNGMVTLKSKKCHLRDSEYLAVNSRQKVRHSNRFSRENLG